jgi:transposase
VERLEFRVYAVQTEVSPDLWTALSPTKQQTMSEHKSSCGRRYDRQFKEDAVALVRSGRSQAQVARDLQISSGRLSTWMKQLSAGQPLSAPQTLETQTPEQRELHRLRQENDYLRQQRDILKKALGILSVEMPAHASR